MTTPPDRPPPVSLDERILALTEGMAEEVQEGIRIPLTYLREAWRGGDYYADLDTALEVIEESAAQIRRRLGFLHLP